MEIHRSVSGFFHEVVTEALKARELKVQGDTEFYLVNLLCECAQPGAFPGVLNAPEPVTVRLHQAASQSLPERTKTLKEIGDGALVVTGLFGDSLARRMGDVDYFIDVGGAAYGRLSGLCQRPTRQIYDELSDKFRSLVMVLDDIRATTNIGASENVLGLYETFTKTGSEWVKRRLKSLGVLESALVGEKDSN